MAKIDLLFNQLLSKKGSDLHLAVGYPPLLRLRGELVAAREAAIDVREMEELLFEIVNPEQKRHFVEGLDLDFAYAHPRARFRANYLYRMAGLGAVFRFIPSKVPTLADLGCPPAIRALAERRTGLVLVTGPTGSGKSTTLAAMIHHINVSRACHILTIEDPVEFVHEPLRAQVTHREVGPDAVSFASAIRSAAREDPQVILVGELRNNETMKLALQLASFGVLVFATVHTNSAPATIERIINAFPADEQPQIRGMLAESLVGIVAQQLLKTADGEGRIAAHEILLGSTGISSMIREGKTFQIASLMQAGQSQGMQTMDMALERLVAAGKITVEVALEKASDKDAFRRALGKRVPDAVDGGPGA
jgi:twitching motility protein PilT